MADTHIPHRQGCVQVQCTLGKYLAWKMDWRPGKKQDYYISLKNKDQLYSSRSTMSNYISEKRMGHNTLWDFNP
jgi:hypothetical protein